jgi:hypothetical protein
MLPPIDLLETAKQSLGDRGRSDNDASHKSQVIGDGVTRDVIAGSRDHLVTAFFAEFAGLCEFLRPRYQILGNLMDVSPALR